VSIAAELLELGEQMLRQRLRREHRSWSRAAIEAEVTRWRRARPRRAVAARSTLIDAVAAACDDLRELGAEFAIVGGLAVSARAEPRLTRDLDVAVSVAARRGRDPIDRETRVLARTRSAANLEVDAKALNQRWV